MRSQINLLSNIRYKVVKRKTLETQISLSQKIDYFTKKKKRETNLSFVGTNGIFVSFSPLSLSLSLSLSRGRVKKLRKNA